MYAHRCRARLLDTKLQQIVRDAETGRRYADKLAGVHRLDGQPAWVLVHVEVQGEAEAGFPARMFVYNHRIRDAHAVPVASLAVLADTDAGFRPERFSDALGGCVIDFRFPVAKLLDWSTPECWAELEASDNVFALVVMAQIRAKASKDAETLGAWKAGVTGVTSPGSSLALQHMPGWGSPVGVRLGVRSCNQAFGFGD